MHKRLFVLFGGILAIATIAVAILLQDASIPVLQPRGEIAQRQFELLVFATILSLIIVVPVFTMTAVFAWRYRASNKKATYRPNWDHHNGLEAIWWGIPLILITILSVVTWQTTHELDPFKPLSSKTNKPLTIQVVALQWRWLFIYPDQGIATVNQLQIPEDTPLRFQITADAPMNSFWIPQLGGQMYAMSGMSTGLNLQADTAGTFYGSSANISGEGFANMKFRVTAVSPEEFAEWVLKTQSSSEKLTTDIYDLLARPSENTRTYTYGSTQVGLYDTILAKYQVPAAESIHNFSHDEADTEHHHE